MFSFKKKIEWQISAVTDIGTVRTVNQDNFYIMEKVLSFPSTSHYERSVECTGAVLVAVCDGMGGESRGEEAAFLANRVLESVNPRTFESLSTEELKHRLGQLICEMNDSVYRNLGSKGGFAGSTVVLFYSDVARTVVANVGDSPCIRHNQYGTQLVTVPDNQANYLFKRGEITEEERWEHKSKSQLTQCLGEDPEEFQVQPHLYVADAMKKGEIYLLSSDGLVDGVKIPQITGMLRQNPPPPLAHALVEAAQPGGSRDNITVVFVQRKA